MDHLNGVVARLGAEHGIATPVNSAIVDMVHRVERQSKGIAAAPLSDSVLREMSRATTHHPQST